MSTGRRSRGRGRALAAALAVLAVDNVLTNRVLSRRWYVPSRLATAGILTAIALGPGGRRPADLGLDPAAASAGLRAGGTATAAIVGGLLVAGRLPATRPFLSDARVAGLRPGQLASLTLWSIPAGTVALEELAFRGVLPALMGPDAGDGDDGRARRRARESAATLAAAGLFGLWHLLPSRELPAANPALARRIAAAEGPGGLALGAVASSAAAALALTWLRRRSDSLLAPFLAHAAANSVGALVAWSRAGRA